MGTEVCDMGPWETEVNSGGGGTAEIATHSTIRRHHRHRHGRPPRSMTNDHRLSEWARFATTPGSL